VTATALQAAELASSLLVLLLLGIQLLGWRLWCLALPLLANLNLGQARAWGWNLALHSGFHFDLG
jgi:hypothetical protein